MSDKKGVKTPVKKVEKKPEPKIAEVPQASANGAGEGVCIAAPVMVEVDPAGNWETLKHGNVDENNLRSVIQYLLRTNAISTAKSCCAGCVSEGKKSDEGMGFVPVILMPIYHSKSESAQGSKKKSKPISSDLEEAEEHKDKAKKPKKRGYVLQRFTDFDLLSQW